MSGYIISAAKDLQFLWGTLIQIPVTSAFIHFVLSGSIGVLSFQVFSIKTDSYEKTIEQLQKISDSQKRGLTGYLVRYFFLTGIISVTMIYFQFKSFNEPISLITAVIFGVLGPKVLGDRLLSSSRMVDKEAGGNNIERVTAEAIKNKVKQIGRKDNISYKDDLVSSFLKELEQTEDSND